MEQELLANCLKACFGPSSNFSSVSISCSNVCYSGVANWTPPEPEDSLAQYMLYLGISVFLVMCSALFSGLTLGMMSLDLVELQIIMESGSPEDREYAKQIAPLRKKGNMLLCTLVLGNTSVNTLLAITIAHVAGGLMGFFVSTGLILLFGEIIPQSICSRHPLAIGARSAPIVKFFFFLFFPISLPISLLLDKMLGRELGMVFNREELKKLIEIHVSNPAAALESGLTKDDHTLLTGVFEYKNKKVKDVCIPLERVFMLELMRRLDFDTLAEVYKSGFTRIPVYENVRSSIVGVLYVKDLILLSPEDEVEVRTILSFHGRDLREIPETTPLDVTFKEFKSTCIHMLFVTSEDHAPTNAFLPGKSSSMGGNIVGIITLEDVLEEMIQDEIVDETDQFVNVSDVHLRKVQRKGAIIADVNAYLSLFNRKQQHPDGGPLSSLEAQAVVAFLSINVDEFRHLPMNTIEALVNRAVLTERLDESDSPSEHVETHWVYRRGYPAASFTLILQGKLLIRAGKEEFESDLGTWSTLGSQALVLDKYIPDFSAVTTGPCRLLQIHRKDYSNAMHSLPPSTTVSPEAKKVHSSPLSRCSSVLLPPAPETQHQLRHPSRASDAFVDPPPSVTARASSSLRPPISAISCLSSRADERLDSVRRRSVASEDKEEEEEEGEKVPLMKQAEKNASREMKMMGGGGGGEDSPERERERERSVMHQHSLSNILLQRSPRGTFGDSSGSSETSPKLRNTRLMSGSWKSLEVENDSSSSSSHHHQGAMVLFDNSLQREETTVTVYIMGRDNPSLPASFTDVLRELGLVVRSARIFTTEDDRVMNMFAIVTEAGGQLPEDDWDKTREQLQEKLLQGLF